MSKSVMLVALTLGLLSLLNGLFMTLFPEHWYWLVPGVPDRGPFNQHFLRDIGINYTLIGLAFLLGLRHQTQRFWLWLMPTTWLSGHAIFHVWEVYVGICQPYFLIQDFPGVTLPALLACYLVYQSHQG